MEEKNVQTTINSQSTSTETIERGFPFFRILYRHIWFIIIVTLLCTALGTVYGIKKTAPIYIGVPGVYYEREKQAAQMFGFVGFESTEHPVQSGSYGYYMIEVEI